MDRALAVSYARDRLRRRVPTALPRSGVASRMVRAQTSALASDPAGGHSATSLTGPPIRRPLTAKPTSQASVARSHDGFAPSNAEQLAWSAPR